MELKPSTRRGGKLSFIEGKLKDLSGIFTKKAALIVRTKLWLVLPKAIKTR
jgi:hypothetical protein